MTASKTRDPEATRQRILAAAEAIFADQGYDAARVDAIAERAAINKRMLYHYFRSKEGLYAAVIEVVGQRLLRRLEPAFAAPAESDALPVLRNLLGVYLDVVQSEPNYVRLFVFEAATDWRGFKAVEAAHGGGMPGSATIDALLQQALPILERGVAAGQIRPDADLLLYTLLTSMICRMYMLLMPRLQSFYGEPLDSPARQEWARQQIITMVLEGIVVRSPSA